MTRLKVLVFGVVVLGGLLILLGVGWNAGRQARRECEAIARERQATGSVSHDTHGSGVGVAPSLPLLGWPSSQSPGWTGCGA